MTPQTQLTHKKTYTSVNNKTKHKSYKEFINKLQTKLYNTSSYWNSFHTAEYLNPNITDTHNNKIFNTTDTTLTTWLTSKDNNNFQTNNNTQFDYNSYKPTKENIKKANNAY